MKMNVKKIDFTETKQRFPLTLLLTAVVFLVLVVALCLASVAVYVLARFNVLPGPLENDLGVGTLLALVSGISLIIGLGVTFLLAKIPLKPINQLVNGMNSLAAGNFDTRLEFSGALESHPTFGEITSSFNTLAEELQNTEMLRSDFINNLSHEFKTPLVSISGFAELLDSSDVTEDERKQYIAAIKEESARLTHMAVDVLNLTKVENQTILAEVARFNVSEQIRSCLLLLEGKWSARDLEINLNLEEHYMVGGEELLKQVWINLFDNAIKFANNGGMLNVDVEREGDFYRFDISNTGATIPEEKQKYVFNKFYQVDESHTSAGHGIGLAVVKRIVELHDGCISVTSRDGLTTFSVLLPIGE